MSQHLQKEPLLRFGNGSQWELQPEGLKLLRASPLGVPLRVVVVVGGGRTGKSELASVIAGHTAIFPSAATKEPVTKGIDVVRIDDLVVVDVEGSDNPLTQSHDKVGVLALMAASLVVSVGFDRLDDGHFSALARLLAGRAVIQGKGRTDIPLFVVVNGCRFEYEKSDLEKALRFVDDPARDGVRTAIRDSFHVRELFTLPLKHAPGFDAEVDEFRRRAIAASNPRTVQGLSLDGEALAVLLEKVVLQLNEGNLRVDDVHTQILSAHIQREEDKVLAQFEANLPNCADFDPFLDCKTESAVTTMMDKFEQTLGRFTDQLASTARNSLLERASRITRDVCTKNLAFGDNADNWCDVVRRGTALLAQHRVGARIVIERSPHSLNPWITGRTIFIDPVLPLSVRWLWEHFNPELNRESHDFAIFVRDGCVFAIRVGPAPPLPPGMTPPRGNARHGAALSISLRTDAWVVVVSEERGEVSFACGGELSAPGAPFPDNFGTYDIQRQKTLRNLGLVWSSREIRSDASGRLHTLTKWVWDGGATDVKTGLQVESRHWKSKRGAKEHAEMELRAKLLQEQIIWE